MLAGLAVGIYAALVALAPGISAKAVLCAPLIAVPIAWPIFRTPWAWLALFFACALLLPPLPIQLGDSGPHIALVFAAAGLLIGWLRLSEWRFEIDSLAGSILAFVAIVLASVAHGAHLLGLVRSPPPVSRACC